MMLVFLCFVCLFFYRSIRSTVNVCVTPTAAAALPPAAPTVPWRTPACVPTIATTAAAKLATPLPTDRCGQDVCPPQKMSHRAWNRVDKVGFSPIEWEARGFNLNLSAVFTGIKWKKKKSIFWFKWLLIVCDISRIQPEKTKVCYVRFRGTNWIYMQGFDCQSIHMTQWLHYIAFCFYLILVWSDIMFIFWVKYKLLRFSHIAGRSMFTTLDDSFLMIFLNVCVFL